MQAPTFPIKKFCFSIDFFNAVFAMDSPDIFSSIRHPEYSSTEYCLILFSFLGKAGYFFFYFLNKTHLVLSSLKCVDSLLSINHSKILLKSPFRYFSNELTFSRLVSSCYRLNSQQLHLISYYLYTIKTIQNPKWILAELHNLKHQVLRGFPQGLQ